MDEDRLGRILDEALADGLPANVALMRLLVEAGSAAAVDAALAGRPAAVESDRLEAIRALHAAHPDAAATVGAVMARARHDAPARTAGEGVAHWAAIFDDLARDAPEAGVALYGLGSAELLAAATDEVVALMRRWGLLRPQVRLLDFGCGIGRLSLALVPHVASVLGLDVSAAMVAEARVRAGGRAGLRYDVTSGRDLAGIEDGGVDVVLAADVFPYLVAAGPELPGKLVGEAARVLRPGGAILILNYSYRGDADADRRDLMGLFEATGLTVERDGTRDLTLWDAAAWLGRKI